MSNFKIKTRTLKGYHNSLMESISEVEDYVDTYYRRYKTVSTCRKEVDSEIKKAIKNLKSGKSIEETIWFFDNDPIYISIEVTNMDEADFNEFLVAEREAEMELML